jgi:hypothetical protein
VPARQKIKMAKNATGRALKLSVEHFNKLFAHFEKMREIVHVQVSMIV